MLIRTAVTQVVVIMVVVLVMVVVMVVIVAVLIVAVVVVIVVVVVVVAVASTSTSRPTSLIFQASVSAVHLPNYVGTSHFPTETVHSINTDLKVEFLNCVC
jgi:hypothetical protein